MAEGNRRGQGGGVGRVFSWLLAVILILGLGGLVVYLASDINARKYRLRAVDGQLVVEKGRFLPVGFQRYVPEAAALAEAYQPIPLPKGETVDAAEHFDDRADLDRALFAVLAGWARAGLQTDDPDALEQAAGFIERSELLPGLSEQQRIDLRALRADLAYRRAGRLVQEVRSLLEEATRELEVARRLGTRAAGTAELERWIQTLQSRLDGHDLPPMPPPAAPPPSPTEDAPQAPSPEGARDPEDPPTPEPPADRGGQTSASEGKWRL